MYNQFEILYALRLIREHIEEQKRAMQKIEKYLVCKQ